MRGIRRAHRREGACANPKIEYVIAEVEEITPERFGFFDYVLILRRASTTCAIRCSALENVCAVTRGVAFIESYVIDNEPDPPALLHLEFYETNELGGQIDNWCGPTISNASWRWCAIRRLSHALEFLYADQRRAGLVAHRRWEAAFPAPGAEPPFLCSAVNNRHGDNIFQPRKDEYLCLAFLHPGELRREDVLIEIDQYGVPPLVLVRHPAGHWQVNAKVPLGISTGDHPARVGTRAAGFSQPVTIRMLPPNADRRYGQTQFIPGPVEVAAPTLLRAENTMERSTTFRGYRDEALACRFTHSDGTLDLSKVQLTVDANPWPLLSVEQPEPGMWQIKARLRGLAPGEHHLRLRTARSGFSNAINVEQAPASAHS